MKFLNWWKSLFESAGTRNREVPGCDPADEEFGDPVTVPVEDSLDLHTFRPGEVGDLLEDYLREAYRKGYRQVRIIHGKGAGVMKRRVEAILGRHPLVCSFRQADETGGGWGATIAEFHARPEEPGSRDSRR